METPNALAPDSPPDQPAGDGVPASAPVVSEAVRDFYVRYKEAMLAWVKVHKNTNFPVIETPDDRLLWVNRQARRKMNKKKLNVYAHNYK